jgi:predicted ester cyclase
MKMIHVYKENNMSTADNRQVIERYLEAISGKTRPPALVNQYVADADEALKQHIADAEAAFPRYDFIAEDLIAEGNKDVVRFNLHATHQGNFMGIPVRAGRSTCRGSSSTTLPTVRSPRTGCKSIRWR